MASSTLIVPLSEIKAHVRDIDQVQASIEKGFIAYSQGKVQVAPVTHIAFEKQGDACIKSGFVNGGPSFVVKIAPGSFANNVKLGLPTNTGVMLVFSTETGMLNAVLLDEGYLTELRTAIAGALAAKYLAPRAVSRIGIVGTGIQARWQLEHLQYVTECRDVVVWGRDPLKATAFQKDMAKLGFKVSVSSTVQELCAQCNLIVTATNARKPLVHADWVMPGTHITAMGADGIGKQELSPDVWAKASLRVADSKTQCVSFGDMSAAVKEGLISADSVVELGQVAADTSYRRSNEGKLSSDDITIADLTGVAVQDIQVSEMVYQAALRAAQSTTYAPKAKM